MKQRVLMGLMIGTMAGIAVAVGLHMLLSAQPELARGGFGVLLARIAAPGARLIGLLAPGSGSHELGILTHWLSLQLTVAGSGAVVGALIGFIAERRRAQAAEPPATG